MFLTGEERIFTGQGLSRTDSTSDYMYSIIEYDTSLVAQQDYEYGESTSIGSNSADSMILYNNKFLITGGAVFQDVFDDDAPRGCLLIFDKDDLSTTVQFELYNWTTKFLFPAFSSLFKTVDLGLKDDTLLVFT